MAATLENTNPVGKPWRNVGTPMRPNLLIMCKLLFLLLLLHSFPQTIGAPHIPFLPALDLLRYPPELFATLLKTSFFAAGFCLILNVRVRVAAVVLGLTVLLFIVASKPAYRNHILIVGCLFFLSGLHRRDEEPWLLQLQLSLIYFGAFLNKLLDVDWRTGEFMHHWLHTELQNPYYEFPFPFLPDQWFAFALSWMVILSEFSLMVCFLVRRWNNTGVGIALLMHLGFFIVVGRKIFGHFLEDILLAMLIFLHWPTTAMNVRVGHSIHNTIQRLLPYVNWDQQFRLGNPIAPDDGKWFEISYDNRMINNSAGILQFLKYNAAFYVFLFVTFNGVAFVLSRYPFHF